MIVRTILGLVSFAAFFSVTTLAALVLAALWLMSPLALGFADRAADPPRSDWAETAYLVSYFGGIPLLVIGQVASAMLNARRRYRLAYLVPLSTITFFSASAGATLYLM